MKDHSAPHSTRLEDYQPPNYWVDSVNLYVSFGKETTVQSVMTVRRNDEYSGDELVLNGTDLQLQSIQLNDHLLDESQYSIDGEIMTIRGVPEAAEIVVHNVIRPFENTSLEGFYVSSDMYCTQCEAEGFRKITFYPDRPDVMAKFTVRLEANKSECPVLLCNGNLVDSGDAPNGRHWVEWEDPFPKPCYLFAMVGGQLAVVEDHYTTCSGKSVKLELFVEPHDIDKCEHALTSLKKAMKWDEDVYGREYDLDIYMIVAVSHFNMGAMENKGLNIFNSSCVLAEKDVATDAAFQRVEAVIAHEYFHNWSGNRVTCRDWFQLSLKEGFTVFRDQEFSADMNSRPVKRIEDVNMLRTYQFPEDAGPMAHPVRPDEYIEINNFYTVTIYEKGAEVVRMIHHLVGKEGFRKGADLYFERHDGQAVTTDDFVKAMEDANQVDLTQFKRWYSQAGTPQVKVCDRYDPDLKEYSITLTQSCPATPKQHEKLPFHIPIAFGLIGQSGDLLPLDTVLELTDSKQCFTFNNIAEQPVPSILRGFSAPIKLIHDISDQDLLRLMSHDSDGFNRWDSGQKIADRWIQRLTVDGSDAIDSDYIAALGEVAHNALLDPAIRADLLTLPSVSYLMEQSESANPAAIHMARDTLRMAIVTANIPLFLDLFSKLDVQEEYRPTADAMGRRCLKNCILNYLAMVPEGASLVKSQWESANNMTDRYAAARAWVHHTIDGYEELINDFYDRYSQEDLVVNMWFSLQATQPVDGVLDRLNALLEHPKFEMTNPNRVRSLIGALAGQNPYAFHQASGAGYEWLADHIINLNALNPQIAARLVNPFTRWRRIDPDLGALMKAQLERIAATDDLSPNVFEVVTKTLSAAD